MSLVSEDIEHLEITKCQHQQSSHRPAQLTQWALKSESKQINDKTSERGDRNSLLHMTATARNKEGSEQDISLYLFLIQFFSRLLKLKIVMKFESQQDSFEDRLIRYKSDGYFRNIDISNASYHSISNKSNFFFLLPSRLIIFLLLMSRLICSNLSSSEKLLIVWPNTAELPTFNRRLLLIYRWLSHWAELIIKLGAQYWVREMDI